jgi:hypothetical protein
MRFCIFKSFYFYQNVIEYARSDESKKTKRENYIEAEFI